LINDELRHDMASPEGAAIFTWVVAISISETLF
jgi:hypothetical protein